MVELELRRSDIGFGRLVVDDTGVTRRFALSATSIAWDEVRDYRLGAPRGRTVADKRTMR